MTGLRSRISRLPLVVAALLWPLAARAQCAMCGQALEGVAGDGTAETRAIEAGVLVLFVPVMAVLAGFAVVTWKLRAWDGRQAP
jgi:hypothetical protein